MAKKIMAVAVEKLKRIDGDIVFGLDGIRSNIKLHDSLIALVRELIEEQKDYVIKLDSAAPNMREDHAFSRGQVASLTTLLHLIEGSGDELERREKKE